MKLGESETKMNKKTILLLGSSGWVAHYVIPDLIKMGHKVVGISNSNKPVHEIKNYHCDIQDEKYLDIVKALKCDGILNMLHAKDFKKSFEIHQELVSYCSEYKMHYTYMSSSNAIDGDVSRPHYETDKAFGGSDYGKYKARCEHHLYANMPQALIIRFPATHGYAPNRVARTEEFLKKLKNGEEVICWRGIYQCRPYVGHLSKMITKAIFEEEHGIFHMSATTKSEEYDFMRKLAEVFGYCKEQVVSGKENKWNMTIFPKKIFEKYGDEYKFSEADTLEMLGKCPYLAKYKKEFKRNI